MTPDVKFGKWAAMGILLFPIVVICAAAVHVRYNISWEQLLFPTVLFAFLQAGAYLCAFWFRKLAREKGRFGPMALLSGISLWLEVSIILHYGKKWMLVQPCDDWRDFTILMALITGFAWAIAVQYGPRLMKFREDWTSEKGK